MFFSIIVPVYNVENYLCKCVDSVLMQDEKDYEILLIDDGSTDRSSAICDAYAENFPAFIHVIHQENNGQGGARNTGLSIAKGEYILFLDSDDYYLPGALKEIKDGIIKYACDAFIFDLCIEKKGCLESYIPTYTGCPLYVIFHPEEHPSIARLTIVTIEAWKRSLFDDPQLRFPTQVWFEDLRLAPKLVASANIVIAVQKPYYVYVQREGSTMHNADIARNKELFEAFDDLCDWFHNTGKWENYEYEIRQLAIEHLILSTIPKIIYIDKKHSMLAQIADYMDCNFPGYWKDPAANKTLQRKVFIRCTHFRRFDMIAFLLFCRRTMRKVRQLL